MVDKKDSNQTISWLDSHDLDEVIKTSDMRILPKYNGIMEKDLLTTRRVIIESLPVDKHIKTKDGKELDLTFITISDNDVMYSLPFNSKALQRSLLTLAIRESNASNKSEIDLSKVIGKMVGLKREQFKAKGFDAESYKFYSLDK